MKKFLSLSALALASTSTAFAHVTGDGSLGLTAGLSHPFLGLDHLLAMLTVGVLAVRSTEKIDWTYPLAFAGFLGLGAVWGISTGTLAGAEGVVAASLVVLGLLLAFRVTLPKPAMLALVVLSALAHGQAHGSEATGAWAFYIAGMTVSTLGLHLGGCMIGKVLGRSGLRLIQAWGTATAIVGLLFVAL
ncbi:MAG: hypothetical protein A2600_10765 [Candidatus Lambdaproteobacteria bacterium RIFOXYD1_FULL_56_27]|uniref:Urease accessory protein UreJ n=1 Tax=Candidatus Lambdaproteobacteria bacterium RIFOXYD2_FULL_56_26 TaxID=1817773 RepID=A0A1F6GVJ6_9PROT|nr:MAG: hypothetical protein A2426_01585 [Candidatus Lambdaproteobacteria bacterium RIFOXYC1_FULL_56_13]OGH02061.1 MAG: hypothetical protein A2557_10485 [Candidatus Lambdaproteobacteria bacterium RIFOXYD2_FULL_56_26]OGH07711.1 MAG: hypothetical protein A2600_10765 [Candidatus Lambdaproteobacteria bacterium RIFOXYD1_FULL_56_27]